MKVALPDSGSNAATALAHVVAEMLGFTTRDRIRLVWGDTDIAPSSDEWFGGRTITLQGAAICSAADKLRKDLLQRAATVLRVDAAKLQIRDGVISSTEVPANNTTFAALAKANEAPSAQTGRGVAGGPRGGIEQRRRRLLCRSGSGHLDRQLALHPRRLSARHRPGDQSAGRRSRHGGIARGKHADRHRCHSLGSRISRHAPLQRRLSCPTVCRPSWTFRSRRSSIIDSLEPRWFYGIKSFSETSIGAVPGAIANAIYNACGVSIREHPITREKIMAGLA